MDNTWRLRKIEANAIYTQDCLTYDELLREVFDLIGYAYHGCLKRFSRVRTGEVTDKYTFVYVFEDNTVTYIFEREVKEDER